VLLGSEDIDCIDFTLPEITLRQLLETIAQRSTNSPQFLNRDGTRLSTGWAININGQSLDVCPGGIHTILKDGDRVLINIEMLGGG